MCGAYILSSGRGGYRRLALLRREKGMGQTVNGEFSLLQLLYLSQAFPPWLKCQLPVHVSVCSRAVVKARDLKGTTEPRPFPCSSLHRRGMPNGSHDQEWTKGR